MVSPQQSRENFMKYYQPLLFSGFAILVLWVNGCAKDSAQVANQQSKDQIFKDMLDPHQTKQAELAAGAKGKLAEDLLRELMQAMIQPPITHAIKVCQEQAPLIAAQVAEEKKVRIGRTSFKLRNSSNQPPSWAETYVQSQVQEEVYVQLPEDALGVLYPIKLQNTCLMCHGTQIPSDLKAAIASYYPRDQATGFSEGDLRGYFWVEVDQLRGSNELSADQ